MNVVFKYGFVLRNIIERGVLRYFSVVIKLNWYGFCSIIGDNKYYGILVNFVVLNCIFGGFLSGLGVVVVVDLVDFFLGGCVLWFVIYICVCCCKKFFRKSCLLVFDFFMCKCMLFLIFDLSLWLFGILGMDIVGSVWVLVVFCGILGFCFLYGVVLMVGVIFMV